MTRPGTAPAGNYTFDDWYKESSFTTKWNFATDTVTANTTLYARWTSTITYNANTATGTVPASQTATAGLSVTLPQETALKKRGYVLGGWSTTTGGAAVSSSYAPLGNTTLYAVWTKAANVYTEAGLGADPTLDAQFTWLEENALSATEYTVEANADQNITARTLFYSGYNNVTINLKGRTSTRTISKTGSTSMLTVGSGVTLILDNYITLKGNISNVALVTVDSGGKLEMNSGSTITDNTNGSAVASGTRNGGGVYVAGTFVMKPGTAAITGNSVRSKELTIGGAVNAHGGGVCVASTGVFTMEGGTISGNTTSATSSGNCHSRGAGVYVAAGGTFTKTGGTITGYATGNNSSLNTTIINNVFGGGEGHAVFLVASGGFSARYRDTTAETGVNLDSSTIDNWGQ